MDHLRHRLAILSLAGFALLVGQAPQQPAASPPVVKQAETAKPSRTAIPADRADPWWVQRQESFNARARQGAQNGDIDIIFLGDSITQGWEGQGKQVWEEHLAARRAVNFGIGGDRTQHVLWRLDHGNVDGLSKPASGIAPRLALLMIGTNNSGDDSIEQIAEGVGAIVTKLREKLPATKVLLLGIFPRSEKPDGLRTKILQINRLIKKLDDGKNVLYFDFGNRFLDIDGTIPKSIMPDALHLSTDGYRIWAEAIEPKLRELAPS